ncbi:MAG: isopeptide-forming domain-containing fimbrial protein [Coprobacillus sp.]
MTFVYANAGSGPSAGGIGWVDFGNLTLTPGASITGMTGTLANGITVTFDLRMNFLGGVPRNITAVPAPQPLSYFGLTGYTGLTGNVVLLQDVGTANNLSSVTISNISVKNAQGDPMTNYTVVMADGETTSGIPNFEEGLSFTTNGGNWTQLAALGATNPPTIVGGGTFIGFVGVSTPPNTAYVYYSQSPTQVTASMQGATGAQRTGFAIGFAVTQVELYKNVAGRLDPADQFTLNIGGTPSDSTNTIGAATGLQSEFSTVAAVAGSAYTINEAMAPGSVNALTDYTQVVSAVNLTPGGTVPPVGTLPITVTPAIGDVIKYTVLNVAEERFTKTVDKQYAQPGDILTYTVVVDNANAFPLANVAVSDPLPAGTTYVGNLVVNVPYTGTDPVNGITLTTIPADSQATISWQVQVSNTLPVPNPVANVANITVPGGTSGSTNPALTQINTADLLTPGNFNKSAMPSNAQPGDTITYTITVNNTGNVAANNVVITDPLPAGTTYVANSITGTVPFTGDPTSVITLTSPLAAGATATFTYQVKLADTFPTPNPIPNTASIKYTFTVDPANPDGESAEGNSNTAEVTVSQAKLVTKKTVDKSISYLGDTLTYTIVIENKGNVPADNVVINDLIQTGTTYVANSLTVNAPYTGDLTTGITLTNPIPAGGIVIIEYKVLLSGKPINNPIKNVATVDYQYTVDPENPDGVSATSTSTSADTLVFAYNFAQQINDIIESVALQQAALSAIANAEGAKIQKIIAMGDITAQQLLCLNKTVAEMLDAIALLESILEKKLSIFDCQINGGC